MQVQNINILRPHKIGSEYFSLFNTIFVLFWFTTMIIFSKAAFNTIHNYFIQGWAGHLIKSAKIRHLVSLIDNHAFIPTLNGSSKLSQVVDQQNRLHSWKVSGAKGSGPNTSSRGSCGVSVAVPCHLLALLTHNRVLMSVPVAR